MNIRNHLHRIGLWGVALALATTSLACGQVPFLQTANLGRATDIPVAAAASGMTEATATAVYSASVIELAGGVQWRPGPQSASTAVVVGQGLPTGSILQTDVTGTASLQFSVGALVRVGPSTTFSLESAAGDPTNPITRLSVEAGKLYIQLVTVLAGGSFEVETPVGVGAVRGSFMGVEYDPATKRLAIVCLETATECSFTFQGFSGVLSSGQRVALLDGQPSVSAVTFEDLQDFLTAFPQAESIVATVFPAGTPTPQAALTLTCVPSTLPCP